MPIHLLKEKASSEQVRDMLVEHTTMIKVVVDVRRQLITGGGKMHYEKVNRCFWRMAVVLMICGAPTGILSARLLNSSR